MISDRVRSLLQPTIAAAGAIVLGAVAVAAPPVVQPGARPDSRESTPPIEAPGLTPAQQTPGTRDKTRTHETTEAKPAGDLPAVETIQANYIKAVGGEDALRAVKSRTTTGRFEMSQMPGMAMSMIIHAKAPNNMLMTLQIPGMGEVKQGFDGEVGWSMDPMQGPMLMPDDQLEMTRRQARFHPELQMLDGMKSAEVVGISEFAGKRTYEVKMTPEQGEPMTMNFGVDDHLLWGMTMVAASPMGNVPSRTVIKEYREFDGIKVAARTEIETMGMTQTLMVDKVESNGVDDAAFELPPAIKSLVDARKARESTAEPASEKESGPSGS